MIRSCGRWWTTCIIVHALLYLHQHVVPTAANVIWLMRINFWDQGVLLMTGLARDTLLLHRWCLSLHTVAFMYMFCSSFLLALVCAVHQFCYVWWFMGLYLAGVSTYTVEFGMPAFTISSAQYWCRKVTLESLSQRLMSTMGMNVSTDSAAACMSLLITNVHQSSCPFTRVVIMHQGWCAACTCR